jgi:hypothetical protein
MKKEIDWHYVLDVPAEHIRFDRFHSELVDVYGLEPVDDKFVDASANPTSEPKIESVFGISYEELLSRVRRNGQKPWVLEKDNKRFAVLPIVVEIPENASAIAVDSDGQIYVYFKEIYRFDESTGQWTRGQFDRGLDELVSQINTIENAEGMFLEVGK